MSDGGRFQVDRDTLQQLRTMSDRHGLTRLAAAAGVSQAAATRAVAGVSTLPATIRALLTAGATLDAAAPAAGPDAAVSR